MSETKELEPLLRATLTAVADLPPGSVDLQPSPQPRWSAHPRIMVSAGLVAAGAVTVGVLASSASGPSDRPTTLAAYTIRLIAGSSSAALGSGTAHMDVVETNNSTMTWSVNMAFSGNNIAETVTMRTSLPPGSPSSPISTSTSALALVDGVIYRQINDVWYQEEAAYAPNLLAAPTPNSFLSAVNPQVGFKSLGTDPSNGWTHLEATHPKLAAKALKGQVLGTAGGSVANLDVWVDAHHLVQQMRWTTTSRSGVCYGAQTPVSTPMQCHFTPERESVTITFSNMGTPQTITAPSNARPGSGPTDGP